MSTRSTISVFEKNIYKTVYAHNDGYFSGVGKTLMENYNTLEKISPVILNGDLSSLDTNLESTIFYHRDRGENLVDTNFSQYKLIGDIPAEEYNYVYSGSTWFFFNGSSNRELKILTKELVDGNA